MTRAWTQVASLGFAAVSVVCWLLMFAAGTDIWHDSGRVDVTTLGATSADVRAFATAFYGLFFLLLAQLIVAGVGVLRSQRTVRQP